MRRRLAHFLSEAPVLFIAVVVGIALVFKVAIGWAKSPTALSQDPAARPIPSATAPESPATTATTAAAAEPVPVPAVPAPHILPRKRARPRR